MTFRGSGGVPSWKQLEQVRIDSAFLFLPVRQLLGNGGSLLLEKDLHAVLLFLPELLALRLGHGGLELRELPPGNTLVFLPGGWSQILGIGHDDQGFRSFSTDRHRAVPRVPHMKR